MKNLHNHKNFYKNPLGRGISAPFYGVNNNFDGLPVQYTVTV